MKEVVITHGARTAIAKVAGSLAKQREDDLGAIVLKDLLYERAKIDAGAVSHVILGNIKQSSDPSNVARVVALKAGLPDSVPAYTVHRQCGSGLQAIMDA
ncbi:MAG: hypothetical protein FWE09_07645, partial [Treponema sp.]|nr:hypothetical protein [Treponema sp.]